MLAARDQENLVFSHQNGAAIKQQQQNGQVNRQLQPKTPGARYPKTPIKIPLNDENASRAFGGGKSAMTTRAKGNENASSMSKGVKGLDKSNFITPMGPRSRAPLGDKTTNARAQGRPTVNVKSAVREIEMLQAKVPATSRPKQKQAQPETQKLQIHNEVHAFSEDEVEYGPPTSKDLPYESDVFPDGVLTFEGLKPENLFKGYHSYYLNPVDEHGVTLADRRREERNRRIMEDLDATVKKDMAEFQWSITDEIPKSTIQPIAGNKTTDPAEAPTDGSRRELTRPTRRPLGTITSRNAAAALSHNANTTMSMVRKSTKAKATQGPQKKALGFSIPPLKTAKKPTPAARKSPEEMPQAELISRTTIGYSKGRETAAILANGAAKPNSMQRNAPLSRSETTSSEDSDKTITPARYGHREAAAAAEDEKWKERVPFLSIFSPDELEDVDLVGDSLPEELGGFEDEEFEMKLLE